MNDIFTIVEYDTSTFFNIKNGEKKYYLYIWYKDKQPAMLKIEIPETCFYYLKNKGVETFTYKDFINRSIREQYEEKSNLQNIS